jgi:hypothetical protein
MALSINQIYCSPNPPVIKGVELENQISLEVRTKALLYD